MVAETPALLSTSAKSQIIPLISKLYVSGTQLMVDYYGTEVTACFLETEGSRMPVQVRS